MPETARDEILISFYRVRQALGYLAFSLPLLLIAGGLLSIGIVEPSISDYYHTVLRDIFVGVMTAIAIFLVAYPGHRGTRDVLSDDAVTTFAGIAAFGVAFFPNEAPSGPIEVVSVSQVMLGLEYAALGHYLSALTFLSCLAYICLGKFSRTAKPVRRRIYRACGWTIVAMTVLVVIASIIKIWGSGPIRDLVVDWMLVLWFEAAAVWAFSLAWLTKGRADHSLARVLHLSPAGSAPPASEQILPGE